MSASTLHHRQDQARPCRSAARSRSARGFLAHLRPSHYQRQDVAFGQTLGLGFAAVFFLVVETVSGLLLMCYYLPSSEAAYGSVVRLMTEIPFGWLLRDLHRLGGESLVAVVVLHMFWVLIKGGYRGSGRAPWFSGLGLLAATLVLAFSGYLLPWDQLAYWAITIGTALLGSLPLIGQQLATLLRGGAELGQDGLLRFYLLHVLLVPIMGLGFLGSHYYRLRRRPPVRPLGESERPSRSRSGKVPLFPTLFLQELTLSWLLLSLLIGAALWGYDAPLESHANPNHTPATTSAPWFFLWLQGALKLGDSLLPGVALLLLLTLLLCVLPLVDRSVRVPGEKRPGALCLAGLLITGLLYLSQFGLPGHGGPQTGPVANLLRRFAPEERQSVFHRLGYGQLPPGIYRTRDPLDPGLPAEFLAFLTEFSAAVQQLGSAAGWNQVTAGEGGSARGSVIVEPWQDQLKRITLRVSWNKAGQGPLKSETMRLFVHRRQSQEPAVDHHDPGPS
ncbi:cytochrome b [Desulfogranum mediterraneum]|uniref:cytochrome b n=1 Tax=Desulfogranum mediterraneum TaxID=160661 RepID=UPI00041DE0A7|nr:cytochrome b N-terminal domain-containing protein [Desulfogranum mediterraneum]